MQKIWILLILAMCSSVAKSQDSTDYTLNNIEKYATHIDASFSIISNNVAVDKRDALVQQAENMKVVIDSIEEEMQYLPDEYYYQLSPLASSYRTDIDEFEKLLLNKDFQDKDQFIAKAFTGLQQRQTAFRKALHSAYAMATGQSSLTENKPDSKTVEEDAVPVVKQDSTTENLAAVNDNNVILVESVAPNEVTTANNVPLLDTIHQAQQQIEQWINSIHLAMKKNNFSSIGVYANNISKAALKISDLTLLLKTDRKESLYIIANGLKNLSETLHELTLKGIAAHNEMHKCIDDIAIKFSTLSTGISLVQ